MLMMSPTIGTEVSPVGVQRRTVLCGAAVSLGLLKPFAAFAQRELVETGTPQLTLGPFYPLDPRRGDDWNMTRVAGRSERAQGIVIELTGQVRAQSGAPVRGASLDVWQTNGLGRYHHPSDPTDLPFDPGFQGAALFKTDSEGRFRLRTVMPQPYGRRQRHIHFDVRGKKRRLLTQMFFSGEPNEKDSLFPKIANDEQRRLATATENGERDGVRLYRWDVILAGE